MDGSDIEMADQLSIAIAEIDKLRKQLEAIRTRRRVVYHPPEGAYPIEHTLAAGKDQWRIIIHEIEGNTDGR